MHKPILLTSNVLAALGFLAKCRRISGEEGQDEDRRSLALPAAVSTPPRSIYLLDNFLSCTFSTLKQILN